MNDQPRTGGIGCVVPMMLVGLFLAAGATPAVNGDDLVSLSAMLVGAIVGGVVGG